MISIAIEIVKEPDSTIPPEVTPVIKEFSDIIPEDLPDKLPPMCGFQHAIDQKALPAWPPTHYWAGSIV